MPYQPATPDFPARFHVAVDVVALTITRGLLQVAVVQRSSPTSCVPDGYGVVRETPRQADDYALPGGHVDPAGEDLEDAAIRELKEETGIDVRRDDLAQIGAFGDLERDPRPGRTVSVAFLAFSNQFGKPTAGSDAARARFINVVDLLTAPKRLEFDHARILTTGIERLRELLDRTPIATRMLAETFTMSDLRRVYEVVYHPAYDSGADIARDVEALRREEPESPPEFDALAFELSRVALKGLPHEESGFSSGYRTPEPDYLARKIQQAVSSELRDPRASDGPTAGRARERFRLRLDAGNFARKVEAVDGFVSRVAGETRLSESGSGRRARVYRVGPARRFETPLGIERKPSPRGSSASDTKSSRRPTA